MIRSARKPLALLIVAAFAAPLLAAPPAPDALPSGGRVTAGAASIAQTGARMDVTQTTERAILEWQRFDIGAAAQVNFAQPSVSSIALNRVLAGEASQIMGRLSANGQVYLVNPSGVIFGAGSRVDVGGLVASALDIADSDFLAGRNVFNRFGATGKVLNRGTINAADGGLVALLAPEVRNEGVIAARLGNVVLAAGERVTLEAGANGRLQVAVDPATIATLVDNRHMIVADGGQVVMSAQAADRLYSAVVANSGTVQARTLENRDGRILLLADMDHGEARVGGTLNASAPSPLAGEGWGEGANGGFVETSAAKVSLAPDAHITTAAAPGGGGKTGTWLIDPNDYFIAAAGGDITGAQLGSNLNSNNITILSTQGATAGNGDIFVNDAVSWTSANTLTLSAVRNVEVNQNLASTGGGSVVLRADSSGTGTGTVNFAAGKTISLTGGSGGKTVDIYYNPSAYTTPTSYSAKVAAGTLTAWMLVNDVNQLQAMNTNLSGNYALGKDIDASATATWNPNGSGGYYGFAPVGNGSVLFTGKFNGNGHVIDLLAINRPTTSNVGLFGIMDNAAILRNVGLTQLSITGDAFVGGLIGYSRGVVINSYSSGAVHGNNIVGGLAGINRGTVTDTYSTGTVSGTQYIGGLIGDNFGTLSNSYSSVAVSGSANIGGLVAANLNGTVTNSYWDTQTSGQATSAGGTGLTTEQMMQTANFSGWDFTNTWWLSAGNTRPFLRSEYSTNISNAHQLQLMALNLGASYTLTRDIDMSELGQAAGLWNTTTGFVPVGDSTTKFTGTFDGDNHVIDRLTINRPSTDYVGLFGYADGANLKSVGLTQLSASGHNYVGGLAGGNDSNVSNSYSSGAVSGTGYVGGLLGISDGAVSNSYSTGTVSGNYYVGGLAAFSAWTVSNSYSTSAVSGVSQVGGLVGINYRTVSNSYSTGAVSGWTQVGGLAGINRGTVSNSYANGAVSGSLYVGGLVGYSDTGAVTNSFWDTQTSHQSTSAGGTGLTTAQMMTGANFTSATAANGNVNPNWDFNNTWRIVEGQTYPGLRALVQPLTVTTNATKTYDGTAWAGANAVFSYSIPGTGSLVFGTPTYAGSASGAVNVGGYTISTSTLSSAQFDLSYADGTLTVSKAPLTVTANAAGKTYDGLAYSGGNGVGYTGFVHSENSGVLGGTLAYGGNAQGATNAGSYTITPSGLTSGNYTLSYADGMLTVSKAPLTVTANAAGKTYDGLAYSGGNGVGYTGFVHGENSAVLGGSVAYGGNAQGATNAGSYAISPSGLTSGNYTLSFADGALTVSKAPLTVTANAASKTYDGLAYSGGNGVGYTGFVHGESSAVLGGTLAYGGNAQGATNAGSYTITPSGLTSGNYTLSFADGALTVSRAPLTVTANAAGKSYDGLAYSDGNGVGYTGFVHGETSSVLGGTLAYGGNSQGATNAGSYTITPSGLTSGNYTLSFADGTLTVSKAPLTVTANAAGKTYDGLAYSGGNGVGYTGFVHGENSAVLGGSVAYGGNAQGATNAGSYTITPSGLTSGNYTLSFADGALTVSKAPLTVTANATGKTYDGLAYSGGNGVGYTGFVHGESSAVLGGTLAYSGNSQGATNAGAYTITPSGLTSGNYTLSFTDGTLTVSKAALTVTANAASKTYDGLAYSGGNGVGYSGFVNNETAAVLGGALAYGGNVQGATNAGGYAITPAGLTSGNYDISFTDGTLTVSKAPLTVTANAASKTYDGLAYSGGNGVGYIGFVHGETSSVLGGTLAYGGNAQGATNAGSYAISPSGLTSGNYTLSFADGALTVSKAPLTVTANAAAKTYDGLAYSGGNGVGYTGLVNNETSSVLGGTLAYGGNSQGATNAGAYTITPSGLTSGNYTLSFADGMLTVSKAPLTVTANAASKTYDGLAYSGGNGVGYSGFVNNETAAVLGGALAYGGNAQGATNAGSYAITPAGLTAGNYSISFANGALTIGKAHLTVTADDKNKVYGDAVPPLTATIGGLVNGETQANSGVSGSPALATPATAASGVGTAPITAALGTLAAANYDFTTFDPGALAIAARPLTVAASDAAKTADEPDPTLSFAVTAGSLFGTDALSGSLSRASGEAPGSYAIGRGTLDAGANYALSFVDGRLTIAARPAARKSAQVDGSALMRELTRTQEDGRTAPQSPPADAAGAALTLPHMQVRADFIALPAAR